MLREFDSPRFEIVQLVTVPSPEVRRDADLSAGIGEPSPARLGSGAGPFWPAFNNPAADQPFSRKGDVSICKDGYTSFIA
jgi:hypothetical protein